MQNIQKEKKAHLCSSQEKNYRSDFKPLISTVLNENELSYNSQKESFSVENSF